MKTLIKSGLSMISHNDDGPDKRRRRSSPETSPTISCDHILGSAQDSRCVPEEEVIMGGAGRWRWCWLTDLRDPSPCCIRVLRRSTDTSHEQVLRFRIMQTHRVVGISLMRNQKAHLSRRHSEYLLPVCRKNG